jgi:hypothetical protein
MLDLPHGKLVNMRPESVAHEFVNATLRPADRRDFQASTDRWNRAFACANRVLETMMSLLNDVGTGLDLGLYEAALTHFLGGEERVLRRMALSAILCRVGFASVNPSACVPGT